MLAVDVCKLPTTGGSTIVVIFGLFMLIAGVIVARWARASVGRLSAIVAPMALVAGLASAPAVTDPCVSSIATASSTSAPLMTVAPTVTTSSTVSPTTT